MIEICNCGSKMNYEIFVNYILYTCESCQSIRYEEKICEHEWIKLKVKIANNTFQGRQGCKICYSVDPKIYKLKDFINEKESDLQKIHDYRRKIDDLFWNRLKFLQTKYHEKFEQRYENYIKSIQWKLKRDEILLRDKITCQICGNRATEVHHLTYKHLESEYLFELISLCAKCHENHYHLT
jgi:hypothetical protein